MANDIDQSVRSDLSTKQSQIKVTAGREPSIPELTENKPVMRFVPGKGLMMYVRYNNKRYHVKFSDDPKQEGRIRVEDVGQPEIRSNQVFSTGQGGTGQDLTGETGAISISSGTVAAGTLPIAVGGTNATDSNTWLNTRVVMKADGVLGYDASAVACTMNTLADGGNIRSRVAAGLDSSGNVDRTVAIDKGGTNATDSDGWLNSRITTNANGTINYDATSATAPNITNIAGTLTVAKGGTGAVDSNAWLNSRVEMNTDGSLNYAAGGSGAVTMNTLTDANNIRARVTGSLASGNGLNSSVAIGDAVQTAVIYSGQETVARVASDETITNSLVWEQDDTTEVIKITFNYLHNANNRGLKLSCLLRSANPTYEARAKLSVYPNTVSGSLTSGSLPDTSSSAIVSVVLATDKQYFDSTHTSSMLGLTTGSGGGEVVDGTIYKVTIGLYNENASVSSFMSAPTVTVFGSSS